MAYIVGRKVVKDTSEFDSFAYGITLPAKRGNTGFFEQAFTSFEQTKSNLLNLLSTRKGERIMQPEFGTGLHELLFEPMTSDFESKLTETIEGSVNFWLPYVTIKEIDVDMTDEMKDSHTARLNIKFTVGNQIETDEITLTIQE
jgi:phage baseplate assembly protein W|tara:strand:+ start:587 stop:1018 length:432 start_codon:yes stop_codon:yes gene_type:complete